MYIKHVYTVVYICIHMHMKCTKGNVVTKTTLLESEGYFNRCNLVTHISLFPVDVANSNLCITHIVSKLVDRRVVVFIGLLSSGRDPTLLWSSLYPGACDNEITYDVNVVSVTGP